MAILTIPDLNVVITNPNEIKTFFNERNLVFEQWECDVTFDDNATQEEILAAYAKDLNPFMEKGGYKTADVINMYPGMENYEAIRAKFLSEHIHTEDEIRFFVDGQGLFWFNLENEPVFNLLCESGDLISVPAGTKHWFDAGETRPFVKTIRIFTDTTGWTPHYTEGGTEKRYDAFQIPLKYPVKYILTDIEGTTTSISFVVDELFPYFNENIERLAFLKHLPEVREAFEQTIQLAEEREGKTIVSTEDIIAQLLEWSKADIKITPLKTLQGVLWKEAYETGKVKGHLYPDVLPALKAWQAEGRQMGIFSSGSVPAQKLLFGYSIEGDLTSYFSNYFDTNTGGKREAETYKKITAELGLNPQDILFLSDVPEELVAAKASGLQTLQLVRPGTTFNWDRAVHDFSEIKMK